MLAELTVEEMDEWQALQFLDGWGASWWQAGTVAAAAHNAGVRSAAGMTGQVRDEDIMSPRDFVPQLSGARRRGREMTAEESEARAERRYG